MTVTFTSNLGLAKPDVEEVARNWVRFTELELDNKNAINDYLGDLSFQTYVPLLQATTSQPSLGTSDERRDGYFVELPNGFVFGGFILQFGSGLNIGSGFYSITLPSLPDATFHEISSGTAGDGDVIGQGSVRDANTATNSQTFALELVSFSGNTQNMRMYTEATATSRWVSHNVPFTFAGGDTMNGNFCYKAA